MTNPRTPRLAEVFRVALGRVKAELRVALPGRVEKYDDATQRADVLPLLKDTFPGEDGADEVVPLPVLPGVPVIFPGAGGYRVKLPLAAGDVVLLVFSDRSLDKWKAVGGEVDPIDLRQHHLSDAVAIAGLGDPSDGPGEAVIEIQADGMVVLGGGTKKVARDGDSVDGPAAASSWDLFFQAVAAIVPGGAGTTAYNTAKVTPIGSISGGATKVKA